jgi:hypothetical protein
MLKGRELAVEAACRFFARGHHDALEVGPILGSREGNVLDRGDIRRIQKTRTSSQQLWRSEIVVTHFGALSANGLICRSPLSISPSRRLVAYQNSTASAKAGLSRRSAGRSGAVIIELIQDALCDFQIKAAEALSETIVHRRE